jgi:hypothetical protein
MEFAYKLDGFDENWSNWTPIPMKEYTNLREGDYKMNVKVRNSYGVLSDHGIVSRERSPIHGIQSHDTSQRPHNQHFNFYLQKILTFFLKLT